MPATPIAWEPAFTASDEPGSDQERGRVAALSDGRFVAAWFDLGAPVVRFRLFEADGTPVGPSTPINSSLIEFGQGTALDIAAREDGGFAIAYSSALTSDPADTNTSIQIFDSIGSPDPGPGGSNRLTLDQTGRIENDSVEIDTFGNFFVAVSDHSNDAVRFVARSDATGGVSTYLPIDPNEDQVQSDVAYLGDGLAVVTYMREIANDPNKTDIAFDVVSTVTGTVVIDGTVPDLGSGRSDQAAVASLGGGRFAIVSREFDGGFAATDTSLILTIYGFTSGPAVTVENQVPIDFDDTAVTPRISADGDDIVVVWDRNSSDGIFLARYDGATGNPVGGVVQIASGASNPNRPDVDHMEDGRYLVTFDVDEAGSPAEQAAAIYDPRDSTITAFGDVDFTAPAGGGGVVGSQVDSQNLYGSQFDDVFVVGAGPVDGVPNEIDGRGGTDTLSLAAMPDIPAPVDLIVDLRGTTGRLSNSEGIDVDLVSIERIEGSPFVDVVYDGEGDEVYDLGGGADRFHVTGGNNVVSGGTNEGNFVGDSLEFFGRTGSGVTFRLFDRGAQQIDAIGGLPVDTLTADGFESISGTDFADTFVGDIGANRLVGRDGDDFLLGAGGNDSLLGGGGGDRIRGGGGDDNVNGGAGSDFADYFGGSGPVTVDLNVAFAQNTGQGLDTLTDIENVISGDGNDTLTGDSGANVLISNRGNDTLVGNDGDDTFRPGTGTSTVDGGTGSDTLDFADAGITPLTVLLFQTGPQNTGFSTLTLTSVENVNGANGADTITGNALDNRLFGNFGNDTLNGGLGEDVLLGGRGLDILTGGGGGDTFVYAQSEFRDTITDFQDDIDTLDLTDFGFTSVAQAQSFAAQVGADVVYTFNAGPGAATEELTVENVTIAQLDDDILV